MSQNIKQEIEGKPVDWFSDVFKVIFPDIDAVRSSNLWKADLKKRAKEDKKEDDDDDDD